MQGERGTAPKTSTQGVIYVYSDRSKLLSIDNFHGSGNNYEQRAEPIIVIYDGLDSPNEKVVFEGTHSQLVDLLSRAQ